MSTFLGQSHYKNLRRAFDAEFKIRPDCIWGYGIGKDIITESCSAVYLAVIEDLNLKELKLNFFSSDAD